MVLRDRHGPEFGAVHEAHERELLSLQVILNHHTGAGGAETVVHENVVQRIQGRFDVHRHRDALAGGQTIGLDHDRRTMLVHIVGGAPKIVEGAVCGRGNVVAFHQTLGEILRALDLPRPPCSVRTP